VGSTATGSSSSIYIPAQGAWDVIAAGPTLYWTDAVGGNVSELTGESRVDFSTTELAPKALALDSANLYWANGDGTVVAASLTSFARTVLATAPSRAGGLATDGQSVYWTSPGDGTVMKYPLPGGPATTLATTQLGPAGIAVDGTSVYWVASSGGTVMKATPK